MHCWSYIDELYTQSKADALNNRQTANVKRWLVLMLDRSIARIITHYPSKILRIRLAIECIHH